jgi:hypothetical protein
MARSKLRDYTPRDPKKIKERAEQTGGRFDSPFKDNTDMFIPKAGDHTVRILEPTWDEHDHYGYDIWVHSYVGPDSSTYLCLAKMKGKPCPICDAAREAKSAGEEDDAKKLAHTRRVVVWVIDRDDDSDPTIPKIWSMSWSQDRDIAALCTNKRTGKILLIDHPHEGYDVSFKKTGQGLQTKYIGWQIDRDPTPISDDDRELERIREYIQENPIPTMLKFYSTEYLEKMISGTAEKKDDDLDDENGSESDNEEREAKQDKDHDAKRSRGRSDDDEPEEKPRRGSKRDDDEEIDEKPDRSRSRKPDRSRSRDDDEERPTRQRSRPRDDEGEDDPPARSPRKRDEEDDEATPKRASSKRGKDEEEDEIPFDEDEKPARKRGRGDEEEEEKEPPRRSGKKR